MDTNLIETIDGRYGRIAFFAKDTGAIGRSLARYGEWAENEISFLESFIPPGATVLDVGAYIGTHTLAFARFVGPQGQVIAFEPQPAAFDMLSRNVRENGLDNVRLENAIVADTVDAVLIPAINVAEDGSFGSASISGELRHAHDATASPAPHTVEARSITIDGLDLARCDLIKIDAEGTEDLVIRGAAATIRRLHPILYAECNSVADGLRTVAALEELGYSVRLHLVEAFNPDNHSGTTENVFARAREAAILGLPADNLNRLESYAPRPCELLVEIRTADDLVLGLLNKPQYPDEVLRPSHAASSGAGAWLDEIAKLRIDNDHFARHAENLEHALADLRAEYKTTQDAVIASRDAAYRELADLRAESEAAHDAVIASRDAAYRELADLRAASQAAHDAVVASRDAAYRERDEASRQLVKAMRDLSDALALSEATIRQAGLSRSMAEAAEAARAEAERRADDAEAARAEAERRADDAEAAQRVHNAEAERRVHDAEAERDRIAQRLEAVHRSTSWRLTRPLRGIGRLLRG